jgi:hypothetical protein
MANKPLFMKGDRVLIPCLAKCGTVLSTPKRRSTGFLFGGGYAYDVDVDDRIPSGQRLREDSLAPVPTGAAA